DGSTNYPETLHLQRQNEIAPTRTVSPCSMHQNDRRIRGEGVHFICHVSPPNTIRGKESFHGSGNLCGVCLERKMACIWELHVCVWQVFAKGLCPRGNKEGIILAPDHKQWRIGLPEIFLKIRIELHIRGVVEEQIQLNVFVPRTIKERRIQGIRFRYDS